MELPPDIDFESGAADRPAFATNKERIEFYEHFTDDRPEKVLRHRAGHYPQQVVIAVALATLIVGLPASGFHICLQKNEHCHFCRKADRQKTLSN